MGASDIATGAAVHALRRPLGALHGVAGTACRPWKQRSVQRGLRRREGRVDRRVGVLGMAWRSGRCYQEGYAGLKVTVYGHGGMRGGTGRCSLEGYAELQVTVYWGHGDMRGSTGVRMVGVQGIRGGTGEPSFGGNAESHAGTGVSP